MNGKRIRTWILFTAILCLSISMAGQNTTPKQPPAGAIDQFEDVHRNIFNPQTDKIQDAGRFTDSMTKSLPGASFSGEKIARKNFIDEYVFDRIERDGIPHSGLSTDEEFLRRAHLDATGMLPTAEKVRAFAADSDPQKRDKLIDSLIGTQEFAEQWAWFYGDLFRLNGLSGDGKDTFQYWNKEWLRVDRPYNDVVRDVITPTSKSHSAVPNLHFLGRIARNAAYKDRLATDPDNLGAISNRLDAVDEAAVEAGRIFLGINLECVSCHDGAGHLEPINIYLSNRTRKEFSEQAAFMGKLQMVIAWQDTGDMVIDDLAPSKGYTTGNDAPYYTMSESKFPRTGDTYEPRFILTGEKPRPGANLRAELARMITSHPQFSRATVNLIWGKLMTIGFVEPYDAFDLDRLDPKNPPPKPWTVQPTNPELLEALAADFRDNGYSIHRLMKLIMKSNAYGLSSTFPGEWKDAYTSYYARKYVRVMTGPEVIDTIAQATGRPYKFDFSGIEVQRIKELSYLGDVPGRRGKGDGADITVLMNSFFAGARETPPATGNKATTLQAILMMKSGLVNNRVLAENGSRVQQLVQSSKSNEEIIEELYLSTLSRKPTSDELRTAIPAFAFEKDRKSAAENLQVRPKPLKHWRPQCIEE